MRASPSAGRDTARRLAAIAASRPTTSRTASVTYPSLLAVRAIAVVRVVVLIAVPILVLVFVRALVSLLRGLSAVHLCRLGAAARVDVHLHDERGRDLLPRIVQDI